MNIVVCLKQVPDTTVVKIDQKTGTLIRKAWRKGYSNKYGTSSSKRCFKRSFMYGGR